MLTRSVPTALVSLVATSLCALLACGDGGGGDTGASSGATSSPVTATGASTAGTTGTTGIGPADPSTDGPATTTTATTTAEPTTAEPTTAEPTTVGASTGPAPTDGPGVLPGETGLEAFCRRYVECGGTYYADAQACVDKSLDYWGSCATRRAALDAFGACMSELECNTWSPDAYNPASTPCADSWSDVGASEPCN